MAEAALLLSLPEAAAERYIYMDPFFFRFFSDIGYYRELSRAPCAVQ